MTDDCDRRKRGPSEPEADSMKKIIFAALALVLFCSIAAYAVNAEFDPVVTIDEVAPTGRIVGHLRNDTGRPIRLWSGGTRWGIAPWRVHIVSDGALRTYYENPNQITGGGARQYRELAPGKTWEFEINLNNGFWLPSSQLPTTFKTGDTVIVVYEAPVTMEAYRMKIWQGIASALAVVH